MKVMTRIARLLGGASTNRHSAVPLDQKHTLAGLLGGDQAPTQASWTPTHRHRKGGYYRVLGHGVIEADRIDAVIYDDDSGTVWVRPTSEFNDGRFERLTPSNI